MSNQHQLRREMRRLQRSMDFASRHPALDKPGKEGRALAEVYQQLGRAWELLALQCRHRSGWRKLRGGKRACKICGTLKDAKETWLLLPRTGTKVVGRMTRPTTQRILPTRKAATVVKDAISFHGARLSVEVLNPHRWRLSPGKDWTIAADRLVELHESDIACKLDEHTASLRIGSHRRDADLHFAYLSEHSRKALAKLPLILVEYDRRGRFAGLVIFRVPKRTTASRGKRGRRA